MAGVTKEEIDDILASVDAAEADRALNSCDEDDSDLDAPMPLPPTQPVPAPTIRPSAPALSRAPLRVAPPNRVADPARGRVVYAAPKAAGDAHYYMVQWRRPQNKKPETWDGDAFIKVEGSRVTMISEEGKHMATTSLIGGLPGPGSEMRIGQMDCEVDRAVSFDEFSRATCCLNNPANAPLNSPVYPSSRPGGTPKLFKPPVATGRSTSTLISRATPLNSPLHRPFVPVTPSAGPSRRAATPTAVSASTGAVVVEQPPPQPARSFYGQPAKPARKIFIGDKLDRERKAWGGALHDPKAPGALVLSRPPESEAKRLGVTINDVVVDPSIAEKLRDHQREGVQFMYRCVMGMTGANGTGCILADEMGLGKTLQTIALVHTLLKQSPWSNEAKVVSKVLIVCPVSLVNNWAQEFKKWAKSDITVVPVGDKEDNRTRAFPNNASLQVMIIGYEKLRKYIKVLKSCVPPIGLVVCDEGHRLKSKDNKTTKMFDRLSCTRRILLTGTPVQNDLGEYWAMASARERLLADQKADFACPGVFGNYSAFARQFEKPILKARTPNCSAKDSELGLDRSEQLKELSLEFVLRRTSEVLTNFLPPKTEYVLFVAPSKLQLEVFKRLLGGPRDVTAMLRGMSSTQSLATIDLLRKVANSPTLLRKKEDGSHDDEALDILQSALSVIPPKTRTVDATISGKLTVLENILRSVAYARDEKIVVVSSWTTTLNLIQDLCIRHRYDFLRLDGSTPQKQRQELVDRFNRRPVQDSMVFLLSAKAGGVGLNLIGASRLVLFDSDWNPSTDLQAMARIHRDGQKKPVFIYRLLTVNTIDEKIYQRQITKMGLSDQMLGEGSGSKTTKDSFSFEELRDIFTVSLETDGCGTHDLLGCDCGGKGGTQLDSVESAADTPEIENSESSSDDEASAGFISASQFDPEPTAKMLRKANRVQAEKLAALKEWAHIDAFDTQSVGGIKDNLLYNILRDAQKADQSKVGKADEDERPTKRLRGGDSSCSSRTTSPGGETTATSPSPKSDSSDEDDSDDAVRVPARRKTRPRNSGVGAVADTGVDRVKKHNLHTIAENDGVGRVLYVFEKEARARI
ncbi:hypothetical protein CC85DRAFT_325788 [Cutaneotrichosporon oleaginosum]|uniref:Uncharacterized protein n=1 Tax=Cutaneotrichosporon oleaginosum TaxID=879819 RepID=A0A0J0XW22_9TREE|nr:uncharacterized protein CC85DRAFT_325788 [Cutaneotrichosporon oleaginosum]KLT45271.1 hypothetical protein CC85DRAFT_325788 [Cutaneotrichosporon oleaginosum]